jgi:hypothetical protein
MIKMLDNSFSSGLINAALASWPDNRWSNWHRYTGKQGDKYASKEASRLPTPCRMLIEKMAEQEMGSSDCFPDLDLHGAGMHWIKEGGRLPLHRDATTHPLTGWTRRFNTVLFLESCEGGDLFFSDTGEIIEPKKGRIVTFSVDSPHEVSLVRKGNRRTLSLFWWDLSVSEGIFNADWM